MAVTDVTPGAGPTGGPSTAPMGDPSQPPPGVDPMQWLQYLYQMAGLGTATAQPNPANMPSPNASNMGFSGHVGAANADGSFNPPPGNPPTNNFGNPSSPANPPGPGNTSLVPLSSGPSILPQARGVAVPPNPTQSPPWFPSSNTPTMALPSRPGGPAAGQAAPAGANAAPNMNDAMLGMSMQNAGLTGVPGPLATGGATGSASTSNPRFVGISAPNASPQNSMRGGPQATALNLAGLFGGRGAVNPNAPAANAQPVSAAAPPVPGPLAANGPTPYGPNSPRLNPSGNLALAGGNSPGPNQYRSVPVPYPPNMPPGIQNQRVANAIHKPNWYRNM